MTEKIRLLTVPNVLTLANLTCGCVALTLVFGQGNLVAAFWLVVAAAVFDFADGLAARLLKQYSPLGKELDSLADVVSFGVVPAAVAYTMMAKPAAAMGGWVLYLPFAAFIITLCSALRLAKFNIDESQSDSFVGLPTPANAIFFVSLGYLWSGGAYIGIYFTAAITLAMSLLLISPVRMFSFKFKGFGWFGNEIRYTFAALSGAALAVFRLEAIPVVIIAYIATSAVMHYAKK